MQKLIIFLIFFFNFGNLFSNEEYFLTLRNEKVNLRQGPSFDYPVKIFYKKNLTEFENYQIGKNLLKLFFLQSYLYSI